MINSQAFKEWWVTLPDIYHSIWWRKNFYNWWTFDHVTGKMVDYFMRHIRLALFCPQRCWSRQRGWITCVLRTETVTSSCCVNRQINVSLLSDSCKPVLTSSLTDWRHQWLSDCWASAAFCIDNFSLLRQLYTVGHRIFLYDQCKQLFVAELKNAYFSRHVF